MTLGWNEAKHCVDHMTLGWNEVIICSNMRLDWNEVRHMRLLEHFPFNSYYTHIKTHVEQTHTLRMPCVYLNFNLGMLPWYSLKINMKSLDWIFIIKETYQIGTFIIKKLV